MATAESSNHIQLYAQSSIGAEKNDDPLSAIELTNQQDLMEQLPSRKVAGATATVVKYQTLRKKRHKQRIGMGTLRFRQGLPLDTDEIVDNLMNDPEFGEGPTDLQSEEIRELATTLANKRSIRMKLQRSSSVKDRQMKIGWFKRVGYANSLAWKRFKQRLADATYSMELWRSQLKNVQGKFGSGVTSYFQLLKFLLQLNLLVFFLSFSLMVLPMVLYRWLEQEPAGYFQNMKFTGSELLTGSGWFNETELYYGYYLNGSINAVGSLEYNMKYAYIFVGAAYYILTLLILLHSLTTSYKKNYIESSGTLGFYYVTKVLNGWDYGITSHEAAKLKSAGLKKEYQEYLSSFKKSTKDEDCSSVCMLFSLRLITHFTVLCLLVGSTFLVWHISHNRSLKSDIALLDDIAMPLCLTAINFILPFAFSGIATVEKYNSPRTELYFTMLRTITLNVVTLGTMIWFWFNEVDCARKEGNNAECKPCWENFMGEQIYRLVIMDFIFLLVLTFISEFMRRLFAQYCCKSLGYPEFNIARNSLYLIYSQSLVWLGFYYSPLLSVVMLLKIVIIFHAKWASLMHNCSMSMEPWRAGRTSTLILTLLGVAFLLSFIAVCYSVGFIKPSQVCGPYQGYNRTIDVVSDVFSGWQKEVAWISDMLAFFTSTAFLIGVAVTLMAVVHYSRVVANGLDEMVSRLKEQIKLEGKDKIFLLNLLQEAAARGKAMRGVRIQPKDEGSMFVTNEVSPINRVETLKPGRRRKGPNEEPKISSKNSGNDIPGADHPSESYNFGYLDKSCDRQELQQLNANNPMYSNSSPSARPRLPFQGQHYDIYKMPKTGSPAKQEYI